MAFNKRPTITVAKYEDRFTMPDIGELQQLLTDPEVADLPVMVLAVIGKCRTGKSFLLNWFIRYLNSHKESQKNPLGDENCPLEGFTWSAGMDPCTKGIIMWNHIFKVQGPDKKPVAVILMDTQGLFDGELSDAAEAAIFTLCFSSCSFIVHNIQNNISEEHLRALEVAIMAKKFTEQEVKKDEDADVSDLHKLMFQKYMFLVRDCKCSKKFPFGMEGGMRYLEEILNPKGKVDHETRDRRLKIKNYFEELQCFLMPYPGDIVAGHSERSESYDGSLPDVPDEWKMKTLELCENIFKPDNLEIKTIDGCQITCQKINSIFQASTFILNEQILQSPFKAMTNIKIRYRLEEGITSYGEEMKKYIAGDLPYKNEEDLKKEHGLVKQKILTDFEKHLKLWDEESESYMQQLEHCIQESWDNIQNINCMKNMKTRALAIAKESFNTVFEQALSWWNYQTEEEMFRLKGQAEQISHEKLKQNFEGSDKDLMVLLGQLSLYTYARFQYYNKANTWNMKVQTGVVATTATTVIGGVMGLISVLFKYR